MKKIIFTSILALLLMAGNTINAQDRQGDYLGLPGDNLNLYAVMNLFQESETIEDFERKLNEENSRINNLDLNGDNYVDYIMATDYVDNDVHNIVLQVALNPNEKQDVAVFTVQKFRDGAVQIQLIGDEALYGRNYIIEPNYAETPNPGYRGKARNRNNNVTVVYTGYDIAAWPLITYMYHPGYTVWRSSWRWGYYPSYWQPWTPFYYHHYYGYHHNHYNIYYSHYRHWHQPRYNRYNDFYYSRVRSYSPNVSSRIREGQYKSTYSRPESRRDGEALYAKTHSTRSSTSVNNSRRSSDTRNTTANTGTSRRSTPSVNERNTRNSTYNNTGTTGTNRRSTEAVRSTTPSTNRNSTTRSSSPAVNERTVTRRPEAGSTRTAPSGSAKNSTERRTAPTVQNPRSSGTSSPSVTSRQSSKPEQRTEQVRTQRQPSSSGSSRQSSSGTARQSSSGPSSSGTARQSTSRQSSSGTTRQASSGSSQRKSESSSKSSSSKPTSSSKSTDRRR